MIKFAISLKNFSSNSNTLLECSFREWYPLGIILLAPIALIRHYSIIFNNILDILIMGIPSLTCLTVS